MSILQRLSGGDRRSIGVANEVTKHILKHPKLFTEVFAGMLHDDPRVRMRAADVAEKVSKSRPDLLQPHKQELLNKVAPIHQQEVQWHVAQMVERLTLTPAEKKKAFAIVKELYVNTTSRIAKASALQSLVQLSRGNKPLEKQTARLVDEALQSSIPSLQARARKLASRF